MPDLDEELIARAVRWCADAGRQSPADQVRAALGTLSWDQLLAVRARLADPPPARPLGPWALADLGRGTLPDVAAERERAGQYADEASISSPQGDVPPAPPRERRQVARPARTGHAAAPVIHRARDRVAGEVAPDVDRRSALESLFESEGRAVLDRLVRKHGARRGRLLRALAEGWRRPDGAGPTSSDLDRLLQAHGLARSFERRERDELLHAVRASGGVLRTAASAFGASAEEFVASLERLGARLEAEAIREVHRAEIRRRATLSERVRLLLADAGRLEDLGVLQELEDDLRARVPEHVRALRASGAAPVATALTQTLAMAPRELPLLVARLGLHLDLTAPPGPTRTGPRRASGPRSDARRDRGSSGSRTERVGRPRAPRTTDSRTAGRTDGARRPSSGAARGPSPRGARRPSLPRSRGRGPRSK